MRETPHPLIITSSKAEQNSETKVVEIRLAKIANYGGSNSP